jgi:hypothetical protein
MLTSVQVMHALVRNKSSDWNMAVCETDANMSQNLGLAYFVTEYKIR